MNKVKDEFLAFINKYKQDYNLVKLSNYKYENKKLYREAQAGWFEEKLKPIRIIGDYIIYAERIICTMSYTRYYIVNILVGDVYTFESSHINGWNGMLNKLVKDLNLVIKGQYQNSLISYKPKFDVTLGI